METTKLKPQEEFDEWINKHIPEVDRQKAFEAIDILNELMKTRWAKRARYCNGTDENPHRVYDGLKTISEALHYLYIYITHVQSTYDNKILKLMHKVNVNDAINESIKKRYRLKIEKIKDIVNS